MNFLKRLFARKSRSNRADRRTSTLRSSLRLESLESRSMMAADVLPVLLVVADQRDFYFKEYNDTRTSIEAAGLDVVVAATTTQDSVPHAGSGQPWWTDGAVTPDIALVDVDADNYSAIVFIGGWGSSMYQYSFPGDYADDLYDGDAATKQVVNNLINEFLADDKQVAALCHAVTVLAWAEVDGVSPLAGKHVATPFIGSPIVYYNDAWYGYFELSQYEQLVANGAIPTPFSGGIGDVTTVADDARVDGLIITGENYDSALYFGQLVAQEVIASANAGGDGGEGGGEGDGGEGDGGAGGGDPPPVNQTPIVVAADFQLQENAAVGTTVGFAAANDPDVGQTLTYSIVGGNEAGAFAINPVTGEITVVDSLALDFETQALFELTVEVTDNGSPQASATGLFTINLLDQLELAPNSVVFQDGNLYVSGTDGDDTIYLWSGATANQVGVWMNGVYYGSFLVASDKTATVFGAAGNDQIYATDMRRAVAIHGGAGHDRITGGSAADMIDGGDGFDRLWGGMGDDHLLGGAGNDCLYGREGNDTIDGGEGDDCLDGFSGDDVLIGGLGADRILGGDGNDTLIGGLSSTEDDDAVDVLFGAAGADHLYAGLADLVYADNADLVDVI